MRQVGVLLATASAAAACSLATAGDIYVDASATGDENGDEWEDAYRFLQDGLQRARDDSGIDIIWVANGTYRPDQDKDNENGTGDPTATFALPNDVTIYGGFQGPEGQEEGEDDVAERDPANNVTILSGDLAGGADFAYTVVTIDSNDQSLVIDGFTIEDGDMDLDEEDPETTVGGGGGMRCLDEAAGPPDAFVIRCVFQDNTANRPDVVGSGGAVWHVGAAAEAPEGEAFPSVNFINCVFVGNEAERGGAIQSGFIPPKLFNCLLYDNATTNNGDGGATSGSVWLRNCTVADNHADGKHGGLAGLQGAVENCIVWGNTDTFDHEHDEDEQLQRGAGSVRDSTIQGCHGDTGGLCQSGSTNDGVDPDFTTGYRLDTGSNAEDAGDPAHLVIDGGIDPRLVDIVDINDMGPEEELTPELDLKDRIMGCNIDRGPYERTSSTCSGDTNSDDFVDFDDLLNVLDAWGSCSSCPEDFNDDGEVDFADLLLVLSGWGPCEGFSGTPSESLDTEITCRDMDWGCWAEMMGDLRYGSVAEQDDAICWIEHYESCHCPSVCAGGPTGCGDDPCGIH